MNQMNQMSEQTGRTLSLISGICEITLDKLKDCFTNDSVNIGIVVCQKDKPELVMFIGDLEDDQVVDAFLNLREKDPKDCCFTGNRDKLEEEINRALGSKNGKVPWEGQWEKWGKAPKFIKDDRKKMAQCLKDWQHGSTSFSSHFFNLLAKADFCNLDKLSDSFPDNASIWMEWQDSPSEQEFYDRYEL